MESPKLELKSVEINADQPFFPWKKAIKNLEIQDNSITVETASGTYTGQYAISYQQDVLVIIEDGMQQLLFDDGRVLVGNYCSYIYSKEYICQYDKDRFIFTICGVDIELLYEQLEADIGPLFLTKYWFDDCTYWPLITPKEIVIVAIRNQKKLWIVSTPINQRWSWTRKACDPIDQHFCYSPLGIIHVATTKSQQVIVTTLDNKKLISHPLSERMRCGRPMTRPVADGFEIHSTYSKIPLIRISIVLTGSRTATKSFSFLYDNDEIAPRDVTIECDDGLLSAHRLVLCVYSEPFRHIFGTKVFIRDNRIIVPYSVAVVDTVLKILYDVPTTVDDENMIPLLCFADTFLCQYLFDYVIENLGNRETFVTTVDNMEVVPDSIKMVRDFFSLA